MSTTVLTCLGHSAPGVGESREPGVPAAGSAQLAAAESSTDGSRRSRKSRRPLDPYVPNLGAGGPRESKCECGCNCSAKERWPVDKRRSKCTGLVASILAVAAESESEDEVEVKLEAYEKAKQLHEFQVNHGVLEENYRMGPR